MTPHIVPTRSVRPGPRRALFPQLGAGWKRGRALLVPSGWRGRRMSAGMALAAVLGVLLAMLPVAPAAAAGQPNVEVTITNAAGTPIEVVPSTANFEYQVRASYTCVGDTDCTNMTVSIEAPALDPYLGTEMKEDDGDWIPPFSPAPPATGDWDEGWTINVGTVRAGHTDTVVFRYFIKAPVGSGGSQIENGLCCSNFFPPGFPIEPEVTVTADGAPSVTKADHATFQSIVPTPSLTVSAQAKVKTDTELPVTVDAVSNCWRRNDYNTFKALYDRLCSDAASITVTLPENAEYVADSGGSYDADAHAVTLTAGPDAWRGLEGGAFRVTFSSADYPTSGAGCAVSESFVASGTVTYLNGDVKTTSPATYTRNVTVDNCTPFSKGTFTKSTPRNSYQIPTTTPLTGHYWDVNVFHQGNVPGIATVTDTTLDQPGMPVHSVATNSSATINVTLDDGSADSATGILYEAPDGRRIVSATVVSNPLPAVNSDPAGSSYTRFRVIFNFTVQPGASPADITNTASATLTYPDNPELGTFTPTGSPDSHTVELYDVVPFAKASLNKWSSADTYTIPPATTSGHQWTVDTCNQANVQGFATVVDEALDQPGMPVYQINTNSRATITYTLDDGNTVTVTGTTTGAVPSGRRIVSATVESEALAPANTVSTGNRCTLFRASYYFRLEASATQGDRTNTASATMEYPNTDLGTITPTGSPDPHTVTLTAAATPYTINASALTWENATNGDFAPRAGDNVPWQANGQFCNLATDETITPQYVFLAPKDWSILADGASLADDPGATFDYTTVTYDGVAYDAVIVTWPEPVAGAGTTFGSNCVDLAQLTVQTTPTLAAVEGPQTARFFVGDAAGAPAEMYSGSVSEATTSSDIDADGNTTDTFASSTAAATLTGLPALLPVKEICQPDDTQPDGCNWLSDPAATVGVPPSATSIKYRVTINNTGQTNLSNVVLYDVLPYPGDFGTSDVSAGTPRGSTVKEELASLTADSLSGMTIEYSTSTNPPRSEVYSGSTTGDWSAPLVGASAIKATIPTLAAGTSRTFTYEAALVGASADQTACNSVAVSADTLVDSEPPRVCASTQEADFGIDSTSRLPLQAKRVGVVPFVVNNGGGSQSATATVTISVPSAVEVVDLAPAGWDCAAPSTTGPVDVTCVPVNDDGTTRSLDMDLPETIELQVRPTEDAPTELCFDALVEGLMHDPDLDNNTAQSCSTALSAKPELLVSKDDGTTSVAVDEEFTYTITASSRLVAEPIDGVTVTDTLPDSLEFVSANPMPTSQSGQTLTWDLGRLEQAGVAGDSGDLTSGGAGSSKSMTVTVRVLPETQDSVTNVAEASGTDPADATITLLAEASDTDTVMNVFTDEGAEVTTPQNTPVTTLLEAIASTSGAPLDPSLVTQATAPEHGSISIDPGTGAVTYNPAPGYSGPDSYQVQVCDTTSPTPQCFVATVLVQVGVNVVTAMNDSASTDAGAPVTTDVRVNDVTQSGQPLAVPTIVSDPADGTVAVNADGSITYTPDAGTSGPDSYSYQVCDTSHPDPVCDTATVNVMVANVWEVTGETVVTPQNTPVTTPLEDIVTTQGAPVDPSTVTQSSAPTHGSISIDPATGAVTYTPEPGYMGPDSYQLHLCDEGSVECAVVTVQVQVLPNVVTAVDDTESTDAGVAVTTDVRGNDTSASGQAFADPTIEALPGNGTVLVNGDGTVTYTPASGFSGTDSYQYQLCDTSTPDQVCDTATVTIEVANVFADLGATETTPHNTAVTTGLDEIVSTRGAPVDPANVTEATAPGHGTLSIDPATGAVTYIPDEGYAGADSYEVRVCDTSTPDAQCFTATVDVTVEANVVEAVDDTETTAAATPVTTTVRGNDTTESGQPLASPTVTVDPDHGTAAVNADGTVTYTPAVRWSGRDSYTYQVCDSSHPDPVCDSATVTVEVSNVFTEGPAAEGNLGVETPHNTPVTTPLADIVTTGGAPVDPATVAEVAAPANGSITADPLTGAVTYTPDPGYAGPDSYTVSVCDTSTPDPQCHQVTVAVTVLENTVSAPDLTAETRTNTPTDAIDVLAETVSASAQDLDAPTVTADPGHGTVVVAPDGTLVYTPEDGYDGEDAFTYRVCDTSHPTPVCDTGTVTITVTPVADLGVAKTVNSQRVVAGTPISYDVALTNSGPSTATEVHSIDPVPAAILDPEGEPDDSITGASCQTRPTQAADLDRLDPAYGPYSLESHPNVVDCMYPAIPSGTTVHDTITGTVDPATVPGSTLVNQTVVYATTYDPVIGDNLSAVSSQIDAEADLAVTKTADRRRVTEGGTATFTVTVVNHGPSVATRVEVADTPTGLRPISTEPSQGSFGGDVWKVGRLAPGQRATLTSVYRITGQEAENHAVASSELSDPARDDNQAAVILGVQAADDGNDGGDNAGDGGNQAVARPAALPGTGSLVARSTLGLAVALILAGAGAFHLGRRRRSQW